MSDEPTFDLGEFAKDMIEGVADTVERTVEQVIPKPPVDKDVFRSSGGTLGSSHDEKLFAPLDEDISSAPSAVDGEARPDPNFLPRLQAEMAAAKALEDISGTDEDAAWKKIQDERPDWVSPITRIGDTVVDAVEDTANNVFDAIEDISADPMDRIRSDEMIGGSIWDAEPVRKGPVPGGTTSDEDAGFNNLSTLDGLKHDGVQDEQWKLDGLKLDGLKEDGVVDDQWKFDGLKDDGLADEQWKLDGLKLDGLKEDGVVDDQSKFDGLKDDGLADEQWKLDGLKLDGLKYDGLKYDGVVDELDKLDGLKYDGVVDELDKLDGLKYDGVVDELDKLDGLKYDGLEVEAVTPADAAVDLASVDGFASVAVTPSASGPVPVPYPNVSEAEVPGDAPEPADIAPDGPAFDVGQPPIVQFPEADIAPVEVDFDPVDEAALDAVWSGIGADAGDEAAPADDLSAEWGEG